MVLGSKAVIVDVSLMTVNGYKDGVEQGHAAY